MPKVVVGMSGGVDSSVTALLLKKQGYEVIGLFMRNWEEEGDCPAETDHQDVVRVSAQLDIPFYTINFAKEYRDLVFKDFLEKSLKGLTPNPDILCNREIKFAHLLNKARELGAEFLATGHYARISSDFELLKGSDPGKDQSYFLYTLKKEILSRVLFPIGHLPKKEVRALALEANLATHNKKDSTGICFIGERDFRTFLSNHLPLKKGDIVTPEGRKVGKHMGVAYYTIGQRKGLNIGGAGDAWFIIGKEVEKNHLIAVQGLNHPLLFQSELCLDNLTFVNDTPSSPFICQAKIRYRQNDQPCEVTLQKDKAFVRFFTPQRAVTPGQSCVFYQGNVCIGGGMIMSS